MLVRLRVRDRVLTSVVLQVSICKASPSDEKASGSIVTMAESTDEFSTRKPQAPRPGQNVKLSAADIVIVSAMILFNGPQSALGQRGGLKVRGPSI
ncbi:hypothetical protein EVAR_55383_1 [Eumeta japonica]|uniref:Uncharacterized protein n=1 Tax=Eumeta variegata TaxID=151549 RepID=A0A4C1YSU7_EUMVA|nr:hypothetical protein EVAR_55383_1 [Eumeta japonica]